MGLTLRIAGQDLYFHLNHPIKWVQVAGIVVAIDEFYGRRIYTIDDSSGATIECVLNVPKQNANLAAISATAADGNAGGAAVKDKKVTTTSAQTAAAPDEVKPVLDGDVDVGDILTVKGNITVFRNTKQIRVYRIIHLRCTEDEVQFWNKMTELHANVLSAPWCLTEKEIKRCRRDATRSGCETTRERKRSAGSNLTGLEPASRLKKRAVATPDESVCVKVKATGLERKGKPVEAAATGLEPTSKSRKRPTAPAADGLVSSKTKISGLERQTRPVESARTGSTGPPNTTLRTLTPAHQGGSSMQRRVTGLERNTRRIRADDTEVDSKPSRSTAPSISTSAKARVTGLERKTKRVKTIQVEGKYSALGI